MFLLAEAFLWWNPAQWQIAGTIVSAIVALITLGLFELNRRVVNEMQLERLDRTQPNLLLYFIARKEEKSNNQIVLSMWNVGAAAFEVSFQFSPTLLNSAGRNVGMSPALEAIRPCVGPGDTVEVVFDLIDRYFDFEYYLGNRPTEFTATIYIGKLESRIFKRRVSVRPKILRTLSLAPLAPVPLADEQHYSDFWHRNWSSSERFPPTLTDEELAIYERIGEDPGGYEPYHLLSQRGWHVVWRDREPAIEAMCLKVSRRGVTQSISTKGRNFQSAMLSALETAIRLDNEDMQPEASLPETTVIQEAAQAEGLPPVDRWDALRKYASALNPRW